MKKVNLLAVIAVALVLVACVVAFMFFLNNKPKEEDNVALLKYASVEEIENYIRDNEINNFFLSETNCLLENVDVLGKVTNVEYTLSQGSVLVANANYVLFQYADENVSDEELDSLDLLEYTFTDKDIKEINQRYDELLALFEGTVNCEFEQFDAIPVYDNNFEKSDKDFYKGLFIKQYSVRDENGVLWFVSFEARYGSAYATISRVNDESNYEGYIPIIDMTKN